RIATHPGRRQVRRPARLPGHPEALPIPTERETLAVPGGERAEQARADPPGDGAGSFLGQANDRHRGGPQKPLAAPAGRPPAGVMVNVPRRNPLFTGRDAELKAIFEAFARDRTAALTQALAGLGGIGKTQTAVEFAHRHSDGYRAVLWARAESDATLS